MVYDEMVMTLQDFVNTAKEDHSNRYRNQSAADVLLKSVPPHIKDWNSVLSKAGFYKIVPSGLGEWREMHLWTRNKIGREHYTWTGNNFWFETKEDATLFALRWA